MEEQKEAHILGSPDFVDIASTRKILHQMSNCICQLKVGNLLGTGFFCNISQLGRNGQSGKNTMRWDAMRDAWL